jgi:hypothetical protein
MSGPPIHFLIVGAMKAGTTTLYRDLDLHPGIAMPEQKEPETLVGLADPDAIARDYRDLFAMAPADAIKGEASTAYTKRPHCEGVAERARAVNPDLKAIYLRRDPIARIVSHYKHERQHKRIEVPISEALRTHPDLIGFSRYDWQIAPWKEAFGEAAVLELDLDAYAADRAGTVARVLAHIGVDPARMPPPDPALVANSSGEQKHMESLLLNTAVRSGLYQRRIKPLLPRRWREFGRRTILPEPEPVDATLSDADREFIASELARGKPGAQ